MQALKIGLLIGLVVVSITSLSGCGSEPNVKMMTQGSAEADGMSGAKSTKHTKSDPANGQFMGR